MDLAMPVTDGSAAVVPGRRCAARTSRRASQWARCIGHFARPPRQFGRQAARRRQALPRAVPQFGGRVKKPDVSVDRRTASVCRAERCAAWAVRSGGRGRGAERRPDARLPIGRLPQSSH